jgi:hypothetical protein
MRELLAVPGFYADRVGENFGLFNVCILISSESLSADGSSLLSSSNWMLLMNAIESDEFVVLDFDPVERWSVFSRLQELAIPCHCACGQPLRAKVQTATAAVQVWSITQRSVSTRQKMAAYLESCWSQVVCK